MVLTITNNQQLGGKRRKSTKKETKKIRKERKKRNEATKKGMREKVEMKGRNVGREHELENGCNW